MKNPLRIAKIDMDSPVRSNRPKKIINECIKYCIGRPFQARLFALSFLENELMDYYETRAKKGYRCYPCRGVLSVNVLSRTFTLRTWFMEIDGF